MTDAAVSFSKGISAFPNGGPAVSTRPAAEEIEARVLAGGSPLDFVDPPDWFSYSAFDTFDRCPRQYALRYLCRLPADRPRPAADFGSVAHAAFEIFTRERRDRLAHGGATPSRPELEHFFEAPWTASTLAGDAEAESWRMRAEPMLDRFWQAESAEPANTIGEEIRFRLRLPSGSGLTVVVGGVIDRIDRLPSGGVELIDYKTGPTGSAQEAETSLQLAIYAVGCRDALGLGRPERVTLNFVEEGRRIGAAKTNAELCEVSAGLVARALDIRGSDFSPTPGERACGWCDYAGLCPQSAPLERFGTGSHQG